MLATIGWAIVRALVVTAISYLVSQATASKQNNKGAEAVNENDWAFPQTEEGIPQCVFFGDCWTADWQVLAYGNYRTTEIKR